MPRLALAALIAFSAANAWASQSARCVDGLTVNAASVRHLTFRVNLGNLRIVGGKDNSIRMRCEPTSDSVDNRVVVYYSGDAPSATLGVTGARLNKQQIRVEVPAHLNLIVRVKAGEVTIHGVEGSKDVKVAAGGILIEIPQPTAYASVEATVRVGDLKAPLFRTAQSGLLCSFRRTHAQGKYNLLAFVGAGQIRLE
ncbi:MAG: hypothetical protein IPJ98_29510 [Bryobacterales bacterium]|nr:hypothetical protein [Bryobacterales bacterium]